ncbi:MAG: hypothetical protein ABSG53_02435 [Thermoguttaceae bacterium]|jgi:hypothetical protein
MAILDLFSKRDKPLPEVFQTTTLSPEFRTQVRFIWGDCLFNQGVHTGTEYRNDLMRLIRSAILREKGWSFLCDQRMGPEDDFVNALLGANETEVVLDIIETSFRLMLGRIPPDVMYPCIDELNHRFRENGVGYQFDIENRRLIKITESFTYQQAVRPALGVLARREFATANKEFMEAWDDFKKSDFDDCLTKCGSCFESVMKIICTKKKWAFDPKATAAPLLKTIIDGTGMDAFFEQPLMLIATIRNRLSSSHGAGTMPKNVPEHIAQYALNATASAILLLVEATGD